MTAEVVRLVPNEVGDDYRFDGDEILKDAMGRNWHRLVVLGQIEGEEDEDIYIAGNANAGESMILLEIAKLQLLGRG